MRHLRNLILMASLGLAACSGQGNPSLSSGDNNFIMQAASGGMSEVALGQMAQRYSSNPAIQQFAAQMEREHSAANEELMALARRKGVLPPTALDPGRVNANRQLSQLSGQSFDQQYMLQQVQDHQLQAALFQQEAQSGGDPELRAFAAKYLPLIQAHGQAAQQILESVSIQVPVPVAPTRRR
ncbi:DUF4142 domain-containing protein [Siccirubricoccus sp. KC 17139]|uniref:DUF4142 domain-containing protein n=1 Tax=Siccirubricoccus soli TaxID=2899147 RepID=A0ABT1D0A6_9PROT|nr:DUF4142 domain-containing protein [Siccirubricoccus soli]MCO6414689.1 DUF4142 domain-containing protein [Siccirubricoccus soli]MCP2680819.1 DUF4142 domain-containing protein [Siccirubricoccus soli]